MSEKTVALLPFKAHSERVPNKNFKHFNDKPLFTWILHTLIDLDFIDLIVINTDAADILAKHEIMQSDRILVRERKKELCGDFVSMNLILEDDINAVPSNVYIMKHVTNPLLGPITIKKAYTTFKSEGNSHDSLFSVNRHQTRFYDENGKPINHDLSKLIRTQDLDPWFEENSNLYIFTQDSFKKTNARIGAKPLMYETPVLESIEIDTLNDWIIAEAVMQYLSKKELENAPC